MLLARRFLVVYKTFDQTNFILLFFGVATMTPPLLLNIFAIFTPPRSPQPHHLTPQPPQGL